MSVAAAEQIGQPRAGAAVPLAGVAAEEQALRAAIRDILGIEALRSYRQLSLAYTLKDTAFIYALLGTALVGACALHLAFGPVALAAAPLFALATGVAFNWINVQIHEASHHLLLPDRRWNDVYCNVVLGAWALQDVQTYRATHGMHHAHLHSERDPDLWIYAGEEPSRGALRRALLQDLLLLTAWRRHRQVAEFMRANEVAAAGAPLYAHVAKGAAQSVVLGTLLYFCGWWGFAYYAAFYLYGLLGVFPMLVRIRTVVQHRDDAPAPDGEAHFIARTTVAPALEFVLVGARMDYHFEHHLYPTLPYYNLAKMHRALEAAGLFRSWEAKTGSGLRTGDYLAAYGRLAG